MSNRLANETSPYLLQHAHNPVDWYPWGPEALERAKADDKPILLSVGYSACHWCHVMERESFENDEIAALMNENFVCIKVDREERPDVDSIYMTAVQAMTGSGGWPMTVFLTSDGKPFYGGTYFPPEDRGGMPAFPRVLEAVADAYNNRRGEIVLTTTQLVQQMSQSSVSDGVEPLTVDDLHQAFRVLASQFDDKHGGIGLQPKFPQPMTYEFLLRYHHRFQNPKALEIVELTLDKMAYGGIYDQLGGGFHRYSTDMFWLVPHFEKMLYDNALLVKLYLHGYQVTGKPLYRRVVEETLDYVVREMTDASGGFYAAQDADSEDEEGKFFIWRPEEVDSLLGKEDADVISGYYDVTPTGNYEGRSILHVSVQPEQFASDHGTSAEDFDELLQRSKARLFEAREQRIRPGLDDKILTSWNGLMLEAFALAASVLGREDYREVAVKNASFLLDETRQDGRLLRTHKDGTSKLNGYLEDYSFLISGLIALHEATFESRWLVEAIGLGRAMVDLFWDELSGQFYDTGSDHEDLVVRPRDVTDNAIPSGSSMAADVLLKLAVIAGDQAFHRNATTAVRSTRELVTRFPTGAGHWACAIDFYLSTPKEVVVVGDEDGETQTLAYEVFRQWLPNKVLVGRLGGDDALADLPLMEAREQLGGRPTAYVCQNYVCQLPVNERAELAYQLSS